MISFFGNGSDIETDYENRRVNYNEDGDLYYWIDTYVDETVKGIFICAKIISENGVAAFGQKILHIIDDNFYATLDYITENLSNIKQDIEAQIRRR